MEASTEANGSTEPPRFVALSALPPEKRLPPRRTGSGSDSGTMTNLNSSPGAPPAERGSLPAPRRAAVESTRVMAPSLPPPDYAAARRPLPMAPPAPVPVPSIPAAMQQIGFNCPSCFTVLVIKDPSAYDGRAAPCPYCASVILPPRVAPPSPFTILEAVALPSGPPYRHPQPQLA